MLYCTAASLHMLYCSAHSPSLSPTCCAQTRLREAERFMSAAEIAARHSAATAGERALHNQLLDPRNALRGTHPMFKNVRSRACICTCARAS